MMRHRSGYLLAAIAATVVLFLAVLQAGAVAPGNEHFARTWARTDQPVKDGTLARTWIWGPEAFTEVLTEPYDEGPGGAREVQYFDKARMEITDPSGDSASPFYVTNGLLVVELMTGNLQLGHNRFEQHQPAQVNVAGDPDDPLTYAVLARLRSAPALPDGSTIIQTLDSEGRVSDDSSLASYGVTAAHRVTVPGIDHQVASPFWEFLNSSGPVIVNGQAVTERLFDPWFYATGYPVTEAYWAQVKVGGTLRLVLLQCFERRCLTYTPGNPPGFEVEAGNVGQHYYRWRYEQIPNEGNPPAGPTATATTTATETAPASPTGSASPATAYEFAYKFGGQGSASKRLGFVSSVSIDGEGDVWVADASNNRIVEFDSGGAFIRSIGQRGTGPGQFDWPLDIAFDSLGKIYVADFTNGRIQKLSTDGQYELSWLIPGTEPGTYSKASCLAVFNDVVYACDSQNHRVIRFSLTGVPLGSWGSEGTGPGQFRQPNAIAFDASGNVYVSDYENGRVQKFNTDFEHVADIGSHGSDPGELYFPRGVAIDENGLIYVATTDHRIVIYEPDGDFVEQWVGDLHDPAIFSDPLGLAIDSDGYLYVAEANNHQIRKLTLDGDTEWVVRDSLHGLFVSPVDVAVSPSGRILVTDNVPRMRVVAHEPDGRTSWDLRWEGVALASDTSASGIAVVQDGRFYVVDQLNDAVVRFDSAASYVGSFGGSGSDAGKFSNPQGIAVDAAGNIYVVDTGNNRIQKFDAEGGFQLTWGIAGSGPSQFMEPSDIAVAADRVYVTDSGNNRVQVFSLSGEYLGQWGSAADDPVRLLNPTGIAVDEDGYVYVVDHGNDRVVKCRPDGELLATYADNGPGAVNGGLGITVAPDGNVYIVNGGTAEVVVWKPRE